MAHVQTTHGKLNKPQDLANDKISSQKMFIDNIDTLEAFITTRMGIMSAQVADIATLKAIDTSDTMIFKDGCFINVIASGLYYFKRNSTAINDDNLIVQPTVGGGRWILYDDIYELAGGTATAITLNNVVKINRRPKTFIVKTDNGGAATTINGSPLYKPNTTTTPTLKAGRAVTVWYDTTGACFFLKASATGNAVADNVLATKIFSNENDTDIVGTMVDNSNIADQTLAANNAEYVIPKGYHSGLHKVKAVITNLAASVIKAGVTVGGILGTFTSDATAAAANILSGKTAYSNGNKITGTMPNRTATGGGVVAPDTLQDGAGKLYFRVPEGYYDGGGNSYVYVIDDAFIAANFLANWNMFGLQGGIPLLNPEEAPDRINALGVSAADGVLYFKVTPNTYLNGINWVKSADPDFVPMNILETKNIFGLQGSMPSIATRPNSPDYVNDTFTVGRRRAVLYVTGTAQVGGLFFLPEEGYYNGVGAYSYCVDPNFISANIVNTKSIFGLQGTAQEGRKFQTGIRWSSVDQIGFTMASNGGVGTRYYVTVTGLTFTPHVVIIYEYDDANSNYAVYNRHINGTMALINVNAYPNGSTPDTQTYLATGNAYVNGSGFQIPAPLGNKKYGWIAYD